MKILNSLLIGGVFLLAGLLFTSCRKEKNPTGHVNFTFDFRVNGNPMTLDTMIYKNAYGSQYEINDIRYFISSVIFHRHNGSNQMFSSPNWYHYIDTGIPSTYTWNITDAISADTYDSISFRFGFTNATNKTNMFVNPPESNMSWPVVLGGGYHYMQLNLKFLDSTNYIQPFNFHLGIGQIYSNDTTITGFVDNSFNVTLPNSAFTLSNGETRQIQILMNVDKWFGPPNIFDFNNFEMMGMTGMMGIMQNEVAMKQACENGKNLFSIGYQVVKK